MCTIVIPAATLPFVWKPYSTASIIRIGMPFCPMVAALLVADAEGTALVLAAAGWLLVAGFGVSVAPLPPQAVRAIVPAPAANIARMWRRLSPVSGANRIVVRFIVCSFDTFP